jgi:excisionase family DNA binding protein
MDELPEGLILVAKAAQMLGCHVNAIHRAINSGKLPAYKVLGRRKVRMADLLEQVKPIKVNGQEPQPVREKTRRQHDAEVTARLRAKGYPV